jgi:hypothetical protein
MLADAERQRLDISQHGYVQPALTAPVVNRHSARGLRGVEPPPPFFATNWLEDIGTTADEPLGIPQVKALSHDPQLQSLSEPWRPMDRRRNHHRGSSFGRVPRPQKEALRPLDHLLAR